MDEAELVLWRIARLEAAIERLDGGNLNAFGRRMGWEDGSYVGQMIRGRRPITEKLVRRVEALPHMAGWFSPDAQRTEGVDLVGRVRSELLVREVPDHVLQTILDLVAHCPRRQKAA